jgi:hypothetical protein
MSYKARVLRAASLSASSSLSGQRGKTILRMVVLVRLTLH